MSEKFSSRIYVRKRGIAVTKIVQLCDCVNQQGCYLFRVLDKVLEDCECEVFVEHFFYRCTMGRGDPFGL